MACDACRDGVANEAIPGNGASRLLRAAAAGLGGAVVGAGIYYAVLAITNYEVGLIAILVGLLVGGGVRWGSHGRGGWLYQGLAVVLTYGAIVGTYVPFILQAGEEATVAESASSDETSAGATGGAPSASDVALASTETASTLGTSPGEASGDAVAVAAAPSCAQAVVGIALFAAFVAAVPFLAGFENIIGWLIIGFALFQAWKMNRRVERVVTGPFQLASRAGATLTAGE
jgi:hypothetical protein